MHKNTVLRYVCRCEHAFSSLAAARRIIEAWRIDDNTVRPHASLNGLTPPTFAKRSHGDQNPARLRVVSTEPAAGQAASNAMSAELLGILRRIDAPDTMVRHPTGRHLDISSLKHDPISIYRGCLTDYHEKISMGNGAGSLVLAVEGDVTMIYTVECSFADPASEAEWNDFYSLDKLPALISVSGFHTSQRFKASSRGCPVYLALHSIDGLDILTGLEYRQKGGGNFARWQQHITDWHRNLYDGIERAPAIGKGEYLALSATGPEPLTRLGLTPHAMHAVALEKVPEHRWLAKVERGDAPDIEHLPEGVHVYAPMTGQLTNDGNAATGEAR